MKIVVCISVKIKNLEGHIVTIFIAYNCEGCYCHSLSYQDIINNSTANASHFNTFGWLDSMIRRVASEVPLLHNKLQSVAYYNVAN